MEETEGLQAALAAEHAVVWGYGVVGAEVTDDLLAPVRTVQDSHRTRREATAALLRERDVLPVEAAASYELPSPVADPAAALALATDLEDGCSAAWRYLLGQTDDTGLRETALGALTTCALQAVRWRRAGGIEPSTVAFPGQP